MAIRIVRLGTPRTKGEGLRIGTVRHPPRGVPKSEQAALDYYDVWLPNLAPSAGLVKLGLDARTDAEWKNYARRYRNELKDSEVLRVVDLLAALSRTADFSVGCYCEDEERCHRSILRELLRERGAVLA